ncbi:MAG: response regulator transcription factor [Anaerolineae bacterium]|nr:response regulator transcription factor [Anaerolineae bacterium]
MKTTIYLADDHPIVRDGLRLILETEPNLSIVGEADNGEIAVEEVCQCCPHFVIMDISMPKVDGIRATAQIKVCCPQTNVIMLSIHATTRHITWALEAGADGYLLKGASSTDIIDAIYAIQRGHQYFSKAIANLTGYNNSKATPNYQPVNPLIDLSAREREVFLLVVEGRTSAEIGEMLAISRKTVDTYRTRIMLKLHLDDVPSMVRFAIQKGVTSLD